MNKVAWFAVIAAGVLVLGIGALALRTWSSGGPAVEVRIVNYAFSPSSLAVAVGTTVRWVNMDPVGHTVSFGGHDGHAGEMDSGMLGHMGTFAYTFTEPGSYEYHCDPHPYMTGMIAVAA